MAQPTWLGLLEPYLAAQIGETDIYERYYAGNHRLAFATSKFREVFGALFGAFADNWCPLIVQASVERLQVTGFRFGTDTQSDADAWDIWQRNNLDAASVLLHTEAVKNGMAYTLVDPNGGDPRITVEHPSQVYVLHAAGDRSQRVAALKKWRGDDGYAYANVYLPDEVQKFRTREPIKEQTHGPWPFVPGSIPMIYWNTERRGEQWVQIDDVPNPLGVVPVVPFYNDAEMLTGGSSDLRVAIPLQDALNKEVLDMIVSSEFQAFKQRVLTGIEIPKDPETGEPLPGAEMKSAISRLWTFADPNVRVTELGGTDLGNYVKAIEMLLQHLAAQTRTPPHYLLSAIVNASGDALAAAETGLTSKVKKKILDFSDPWEETIRLAFLAKGDDVRGQSYSAHTLWADPEQKTDAQKADAATKYRSIGVPLESCLAIAGFSSQEIDRMKQLPDWNQPPIILRDTATFRDATTGQAIPSELTGKQ